MRLSHHALELLAWTLLGAGWLSLIALLARCSDEPQNGTDEDLQLKPREHDPAGPGAEDLHLAA